MISKRNCFLTDRKKLMLDGFLYYCIEVLALGANIKVTTQQSYQYRVLIRLITLIVRV